MKKKRNTQAEFVKWFGPLLNALRQLGGSAKPREASEKISENLDLKDDKLNEMLKSGQSRFYNQVAWARQYLAWEGLIDTSQHGIWALSSKGENTTLNAEQASEIFFKWVSVHSKAKPDKSEKEIIKEQEESKPDEIQPKDKSDLLQVLQSLTPSGFEKICQRLLRESGFENVIVTGQSHDGGIDGYGTLEMNPFVSFKVLFQCKRYKGTVSRAQVGDFRNAMIGRAEKGIIMTTGTFSSDAIKEANRDGAPQVELVDGEKLVEMFEKVELGVKPRVIYEVNLPFFEPYIDEANKRLPTTTTDPKLEVAPTPPNTSAKFSSNNSNYLDAYIARLNNPNSQPAKIYAFIKSNEPVTRQEINGYLRECGYKNPESNGAIGAAIQALRTNGFISQESKADFTIYKIQK